MADKRVRKNVEKLSLQEFHAGDNDNSGLWADEDIEEPAPQGSRYMAPARREYEPPVPVAAAHREEVDLSQDHTDKWQQRDNDRRYRGGSGGGGRSGGFKQYDGPRRSTPDIPIPDVPPFTARISNLDDNVDDDDIYSVFCDCGDVDEYRCVPDRSGHPMYFIEFSTQDGLRSALQKDGRPLRARSIRVGVAEPRSSDRRGGGFQRTGGGGGGYMPAPGERDVQLQPRHQRPKIALKARTVDSEGKAPDKMADAYSKSGKSNPFGDAKPRDEAEVMKRLEEQRKAREQREREKAQKEMEKQVIHEEREQQEKEQERGRRDKSKRARDAVIRQARDDSNTNWREEPLPDTPTGGDSSGDRRRGRRSGSGSGKRRGSHERRRREAPAEVKPEEENAPVEQPASENPYDVLGEDGEQ